MSKVTASCQKLENNIINNNYCQKYWTEIKLQLKLLLVQKKKNRLACGATLWTYFKLQKHIFVNPQKKRGDDESFYIFLFIFKQIYY